MCCYENAVTWVWCVVWCGCCSILLIKYSVLVLLPGTLLCTAEYEEPGTRPEERRSRRRSNMFFWGEKPRLDFEVVIFQGYQVK